MLVKYLTAKNLAKHSDPSIRARVEQNPPGTVYPIDSSVLDEARMAVQALVILNERGEVGRITLPIPAYNRLPVTEIELDG